MQDRRADLIALLQLAYSGELAAAYAYRGHARSVRDAGEKQRIGEIEADEWHHRRMVGEMLESLGAAPDPRRERRAARIGRLLSMLCHVSGWLIPMYGAGRLERRNIGEYEEAARLAVACDRTDLVDCLLSMAEVEWDHEDYFRGRVVRHRFASRIPMWDAPPPRESIRPRFATSIERPAEASSFMAPVREAER
ncbi:MAG TPA: ferritin-like domain-containing protein [Thermoanaerobaculia bacterium]|nr:ferritin-like domain-containing protein [Thermoanaerobaculia bacterium]